MHRVVTPYAHLHENKVYMALDQFSVHMQHNNTTALQQIGVEVGFIPPGYTSVLQVLDKGVHKPFKQYLREESMAFMLRNPEGTKPTRTDIALWIRNSWEKNTTYNYSQHLGVHWYSTNRPLPLIADCHNNNLNNNNRGSRHVKKIASRPGVVDGFPPQLSCSFDGCCNFL